MNREFRIIKFIRNKFTEKTLSIKKDPKLKQMMNLNELKGNNYLKFHINADLVLEFLSNKLLNLFKQTFWRICLILSQLKNHNFSWLHFAKP